MNWYTTFQIPKATRPIYHGDRILSIGSCFAQVIGDQLSKSKFETLVNPYGTLFNPISISKALMSALVQNPPNLDLITERDGLFFHYDYPSALFGSSQHELVEKIQKQQHAVANFIQKCDVILLTLGTAWVYVLENETEPLANCHKQPQKGFEKRLLKLDEMRQSLHQLISTIQTLRPEVQIILTVSPVRHIKDGIPENQLSKSLLRVLCGELTKDIAQADYFPAYEIVMDELRDYRFYKADRIHPSEEAENYIWKRWSETCLSEQVLEKVKEIEKVQAELNHRALNPSSQSHRQFLQQLLEKLERLDVDFDFSNEISQVKTQLTS